MTVDTHWLVDFFQRQARLGFEEGDYTRTRNSCREVLQYVPDDVECWTLLGEAALASNDSVTALRAFDKLLELEPECAEHAMRLGQACLQAQDWPAAISAFQQVLELQPEHQGATEALALLAQLLERLSILDQIAPDQPGRNDPCPCGSGLKYKRCCLEKSSQSAMSQRLEQAFAGRQWQQVLSVADELQATTPAIRRAVALARYELSQRDKAYPLLKDACREWPDDLELRAALADLELDHRLANAKALAESTLAADPGQWRASLVLAAVHARQGQPQRSEATLRELLRHNPDCDLAWQRLSYFLRESKRLEDDLQAMQEWSERCPQKADAWCHRGMSALMTDRLGESRQYLERALSLDPNHYEALCWLGQTYQSEHEPQKALEFLTRGLQIKPDYQPGWNMLGGLYQSVGRQHEAEGCFMRALAISPLQALAWNNLANTYLDGHVLDEAEHVMQVALQLNPGEASLWVNLGNILNARRQVTEAIECYRKAMELDGNNLDARANYGTALSHFARCDESIQILEPLSEHYAQPRSNILFVANCHPDWSAERIYELYRRQITRHFPQRQYFSYANTRDTARRIRIGYVSPDFRGHACANFSRPLLGHHDRQAFEVFAYSEVRREDGITELMIGEVEHWRRTVGMSDEQLAEMIRADGIDILVDLAGHTAGNRLTMFALKPAPVQVMWWMGFGYSTGLDSIDYFLADEELVPPGSDHVFAEQPWRIPCPSIAYLPRTDLPDVGELPALRNGYVTFGTLTRPIRLNYKVIRAWAEILQRVPGSKLVLNSGPFADAGLCDYFAAEFAKHGIERERLDMGCTSPPWPVLAEMDIALDCFPHNSGTTLFESLWMGLPYVTLRDRPSMGRIGAEILRGLGREEWIADTEAQYIDKAVAMAGDLQALQAIRAGLREQMLHSAICDGPLLARRVEDAYRGMWQRYCEQGEQP